MNYLLSLMLLVVSFAGKETIVLHDPFVIKSNDTVRVLYSTISARVSHTSSPGISIIFNGKIILNFINDHRTIKDIGMTNTMNDIQVIHKPDFAALLEMISDIDNIQNIPWLLHAMDCVNHPLENDWLNGINGSDFGESLVFDENGTVTAVDLSQLNLTGTIHLESLPQSIRSLDLSFNDLDTLNLNGIRGKSLEKLNLEHNHRCHINTECFLSDSRHNLTITELTLSSNQIFPWITDFKDKCCHIQRLIDRHSTLDQVIIDGLPIFRSTGRLSIHSRMLRVIDGVTNKQVIPWYHLFVRYIPIQPRINLFWKDLGVYYMRRRVGYSARYRFDLSGLGLEGHIDLGYLPRNVAVFDISNNNVSSMSFLGEGPFSLRRLHVQNNDKLLIDLADIDAVSQNSCFRHLKAFRFSSNQLQINGVLDEIRMTKEHFVRLWMQTTMLQEVVMDDTWFLPDPT